LSGCMNQRRLMIIWQKKFRLSPVFLQVLLYQYLCF